ncbi:MAG: GNAT family N-acetyltransferase [Bacillaceae bacterium]
MNKNRGDKVEEIILSGEHVLLRPMTEEDVQGLFEASKEESIWAYMPMSVRSIDDVNKMVKDALKKKEAGTEYPFVIIHKESNKIVGSTRFLDISVLNRNLEIGWTWYNPSVWRTAVNTECKYLLLTYCFETLKCIRVQLKTDERNIRSQVAIQRIGARKEGTLRNHRILANGFYRNTVMFSIIDSEWKDAKDRLEKMMEGKQE